MSDKPNPLANEILQARKPRLNVTLPPRQDLPDAMIEESSRRIGEKYGANTRLVPEEPPEEVVPTAPLVSVRFDFPDYVDQQLAVRAATTKGPSGGKVTKTYLALKALKDAGYRVDDVDLVEDRRREKRSKR
jgi:hypothetical protein